MHEDAEQKIAILQIKMFFKMLSILISALSRIEGNRICMATLQCIEAILTLAVAVVLASSSSSSSSSSNSNSSAAPEAVFAAQSNVTL